MRKLIPLALCGVLLAGCASSSRSTMLTDDTALISVLSQGDSNRAKVIDQALAEAARATRAHGYRYFVIIDTADASQTGVKIRRGRPVHIQDIPGIAKGGSALSSNYIGGPGGANYTTPDDRIPYVRIGVDVTIRMYLDGEVTPDTEGVWNSDVVLNGGAASR